jgi:hypothetical protein
VACRATRVHTARMRLIKCVKRLGFATWSLAAGFGCLADPLQAAAEASVLMRHNDIGQTGQNLGETVLTTSNVGVATFGKLFSRSVDGPVHAQVLYVANLDIKGSRRNVVYVATENNSVYAFEADDPRAADPLWRVSLGTPTPYDHICVVLGGDKECYRNLVPVIGITGTPVIDAAPKGGGTIYVVAKTKDTARDAYHFRLHALDLATGAEKFGGPAEIAGQVAGTGSGSAAGMLAFDPAVHLNRPGLLLLKGVVYAAFGSMSDYGDYHGWVFGYDAATLRQVSVFNATANGKYGGIWQNGQSPVGDSAGNVYLITSNGTFNADAGGKNYGQSFVKLNPRRGLSVADYFTPHDHGSLSEDDADLGAGGPMAIPGTHLIVGGGKDGILRVVDTGRMGKFSAGANRNVQEFRINPGTPASGIGLGSPVFWQSPNYGPLLYVWGANDTLKAFAFSGRLFRASPIMQGSVQPAAGYANVSALSLSANGCQAGTGIVWASAANTGDTEPQPADGILRAFDAMDLSKELWNSRQNAARDDVGKFAKFNPPTIANGKVFQPTASGQVQVYGLLTEPVPLASLPAPSRRKGAGGGPLARLQRPASCRPGLG